MLIRMIVVCLFLSVGANPSLGQLLLDDPAEMQGVDIVEHLGEKIPLDLEFSNSKGETVRLGDYFNRGVPVMLQMHYSDCPMLCSLVLNCVSNGVGELGFRAGVDFYILTVSINPNETLDRCSQSKERYLNTLNPGSSDDAWEFLTGDQTSITALTNALGFGYRFVEETGEFAHTAVNHILTEDGRISRYLYGIEFPERDLRLSLVEASEGKIGTTIDRLILYCFHYDPESRGYVAMAGNIMRMGGVVVLLLLGTLIGGLWSRERKLKGK